MNSTQKRVISLVISGFFSSVVLAQTEISSWIQLTEQYRQTELEQFDAQQNLQNFQHFLHANPDNALAQLYTGSSYCFIGRDAWMPWNKLNAVNTCIDKMEMAYINVQNQYATTSAERLNADLTIGLTSAALPDMFAQQQTTIATLSHARNHPAFKYLPEQLQSQAIDSLAKYQPK